VNLFWEQFHLYDVNIQGASVDFERYYLFTSTRWLINAGRFYAHTVGLSLYQRGLQRDFNTSLFRNNMSIKLLIGQLINTPLFLPYTRTVTCNSSWSPLVIKLISLLPAFMHVMATSTQNCFIITLTLAPRMHQNAALPNKNFINFGR